MVEIALVLHQQHRPGPAKTHIHEFRSNHDYVRPAGRQLLMVNEKKADPGPMAMGVPFFSSVDSTYRSLREVFQLCESSFIQYLDDPPVGLHLFCLKNLPVAAPKRVRQFLQESFIVNGLATEDFLEIVVQGRTTVILGVAYGLVSKITHKALVWIPYMPLTTLGANTMRLQDLIDEASALPVDERALVVESLLKSLNPIEASIDEKWTEVAESRLGELDSGKVNPVPGDEVFRKIRSRLQK